MWACGYVGVWITGTGDVPANAEDGFGQQWRYSGGMLAIAWHGKLVCPVGPISVHTETLAVSSDSRPRRGSPGCSGVFRMLLAVPGERSALYRVLTRRILHKQVCASR